MKISRYLAIVILLVGILPIYPPKVYAESSTIAATISITVLGTPKAQIEQLPDAKECLESQLQKNPQSLPEIKVEKIAQNPQLLSQQMIRYTICERP